MAHDAAYLNLPYQLRTAQTTIQILALSRNNTFDQPLTPDGQQWRTAISYLIDCPKWSRIYWGRHYESPNHVTLLTKWCPGFTIPTFLETHYPAFIDLLEPLLDPTSPPEPPDAISYRSPIRMNRVTTISRLTFDTLSPADRMEASFKFDNYKFKLRENKREKDGVADGGCVAKWAVDPVTGEWSTRPQHISLEAEQQAEQLCWLDNGENIKEACLGQLLRSADSGGRVHHVSWNTISSLDVETWKETGISIFKRPPMSFEDVEMQMVGIVFRREIGGPLQLACYQQELEIVKILIEVGVDASVVDETNDTLLQIACFSKSGLYDEGI
ncbi:hypothetical protein G7Y89_g6294 [Cudoniella acicularis]|uniref:Ankyrin n=1 Tax=Cudoniella acicularis TaxID=354080 RepID=A0A8H4RN78_9HELO|nr:hypothetical protein G7Y89_g6294 [Cudoniella acicularis]